MRHIDRIIIHCSATPPDMDIGVKEIDEWHKARGWSGIGYHYVIRRIGFLEYGRNLNRIGAHVKGKNRGSVGICLVGGHHSHRDDLPSEHYTEHQLNMLVQVVRGLKITLPGLITVHGHNEFSSKACPGFQVPKWWGAQ